MSKSAMKLKVGDKRVLVISDLQEPFAHKDAFAFVSAVKEQYETDTTVIIGDEVDFHAMSPSYVSDPDGKSPGDELKAAKKALVKWVDLLKDEEEVSVCYSNHLHRIFKKCFLAGVPTAFIREINDFLGVPASWVWKDVFHVDGVRYEHGDNAGGVYAARNLAIARREATVIGHHHSHAGVFYINTDDGDCIFGMNVGCLIDNEKYAFKYAKGNRFGQTLGCGVVLYGVPYFIPMITSSKGNWIGELI